MLPDLSAAHIFLLVVVALVVVGPKDLPALLRKIGQFTARLRGMANEFRASFDEMSRQSELDELRREVAAMRSAATKPLEEFRTAADDLHGELNNGMSDFSLAAPPIDPALVPTDPDPAPLAPLEAAEAPVEAKPRKAKAPAKLKAVAAEPEVAAAKPQPKPKATQEKPPAKGIAKPARTKVARRSGTGE